VCFLKTDVTQKTNGRCSAIIKLESTEKRKHFNVQFSFFFSKTSVLFLQQSSFLENFVAQQVFSILAELEEVFNETAAILSLQ
jgi:hypothetical protein